MVLAGRVIHPARWWPTMRCAEGDGNGSWIERFLSALPASKGRCAPVHRARVGRGEQFVVSLENRQETRPTSS